MLHKLSRDDRFRVFLLGLSIIGVAFIGIATSKYGAGVSSDAARNLSTADNLLAGRGFVDMIGEPFVLWPPLYPLVLAGLSLLTRWSTFQSAWYLNAFLYAANIWIAGWLLYLMFRDRPGYAAVGALAILLSRSMLRIHANVASEPLFETLILVFFLVAATYLKTASPAALWAICLLAGLAALQRYPGVILFGVILLLVIRKERAQALPGAVPPLLISALPIAAWAVLHNIPVSGGPFGPRELGAMLPIQNVGLSLTKILWWFIPRAGFLDWLVLRPWIPLAAFTAFLLAFNRTPDWYGWFRALLGEYIWPGLVFSVLYFFVLAFTVVTADHLDLTSDRYYVVLLPFILALLFLTLDRLILNHIDLRRLQLRLLLTAVFAIWAVYPLYSIQTYLRQAVVQGEPTNYNIANSANFRAMSVVKAAAPLVAMDPGAVIYSNYLNIVWFIYHHPVAPLPFEDAALPRAQRQAALQRDYPGWPPQAGYIIWFTPNQYHHIVAPVDLASIADLKLLFEDKTGQVYLVTPRITP
jgi:hypothetical protein